MRTAAPAASDAQLIWLKHLHTHQEILLEPKAGAAWLIPLKRRYLASWKLGMSK